MTRRITDSGARMTDVIARPLAAAAACLTITGVLTAWAYATTDPRTLTFLSGALLCLAAAAVRTAGLSWLSPWMVYLVVLGVFHLGFAVPWAMGVAQSAEPFWVRLPQLVPALRLVAVALASYLVGAFAARLLLTARREAPHVAFHNRGLYGAGVAVYAVGLATFAWGVHLLGIGALWQATYVDIYRLTKESDPRFFVTSFMLVPVGLYLAAAGAPRRRWPLVWTLLAAWGLASFGLGFRGFALIPALTVSAVLHRRGFRLPRWMWSAALVTLLFVIPLGRALRDEPLVERRLDRAMHAVHPSAALEEMGGSLGPLIHTLRFIETEPLRWGSTYGRALRRIVPNVAVSWGGGSYVTVDELPPSQWVTLQAAPWKYHHHGGLGFSAIAEPFMNFGTPGVMVYFFGLSAALWWVEQHGGNRPTWLAVWAVVLGPLLWTTRGSFESFFRPVVWGLLIIAAARFVGGRGSAAEPYPSP